MSEQKHFTQEQAQAMYATLAKVGDLIGDLIDTPDIHGNVVIAWELAQDTLQAIDSAGDDIALEFDVDSFTPHEAKTLADKIDAMLPAIEAAEAKGRYRVFEHTSDKGLISYRVVDVTTGEWDLSFTDNELAQAEADRLNGGGA